MVLRSPPATAVAAPHAADLGPRYKWVVLSNTSLGGFMAILDSAIVIIAMPTIFRGIGLNPLSPGNIGYLLWLIMGYLLVMSALVVSVGRLGDMFGRVRIYNLGFVVFTAASVALSLDPYRGQAGAMWLILWRMVQAFGGAMLMANSVAILTDAFPLEQRGTALGINSMVSLSGQFIGLVAGGLLAAWDWRAVFWVNVPFGAFGTVWAYLKLRETSPRRPGRIDWWGNITFALGLALVLIGSTYGVQPYHHDTMGWSSPRVIGALALGAALLAAFCVIETRVAEPMFRLGLFRIRAFALGSVTALVSSVARSGVQFMLIIWLQGIWLPLHGYDYTDTPLWAGIFLLPLTLGFVVSAPLSGHLSDRFGVRIFTTAGMLIFAASLRGTAAHSHRLSVLDFALLIFGNSFGIGMFNSPNTSAMMSSVPAADRGGRFRNAGYPPQRRYRPPRSACSFLCSSPGCTRRFPNPCRRASRPREYRPPWPPTWRHFRPSPRCSPPSWATTPYKTCSTLLGSSISCPARGRHSHR